MPHKQFVSPFIHWQEVPQHNQIKSILLPRIHNHNKQHGKRDVGNALTTCFTPLNDNASILDKDLVNDIIWKQFDKMIEELQLYPTITESFLKHIWYNVYDPGDYAIAHSHTNADFCGMYLLDCPADNNTLFHHNISSTSYPFDMGAYTTEHIKEGNVLFWPSYLMHSATPCKTERTVVVFNITSDYIFDAEDHTH